MTSGSLSEQKPSRQCLILVRFMTEWRVKFMFFNSFLNQNEHSKHICTSKPQLDNVVNIASTSKVLVKINDEIRVPVHGKLGSLIWSWLLCAVSAFFSLFFSFSVNAPRSLGWFSWKKTKERALPCYQSTLIIIREKKRHVFLGWYGCITCSCTSEVGKKDTLLRNQSRRRTRRRRGRRRRRRLVF